MAIYTTSATFKTQIRKDIRNNLHIGSAPAQTADNNSEGLHCYCMLLYVYTFKSIYTIQETRKSTAGLFSRTFKIRKHDDFSYSI